MTRLFIAIDIPENISKLVAGMGRSVPGATPVAAEQLHLTIKFIGEVEGSKQLDICDKLEHVVFAPFKLSLRGVGTFPPRGTPRILWAGVEPKEDLLRLHNFIGKALTSCGVPQEKRKFAPHLTLARLKNCPAKNLFQFIAGNSFLQSPEFTIAQFSLYSSKLSPKGAIHTTLKTYLLK